VVADPSHGIGIRRHVEPIALASVMAGADGVIFETHSNPFRAFSDGQQTLDFRESEKLIRKMRASYELLRSF
jgi:3-deoxy-7-phosphoheptulonate synthase